MGAKQTETPFERSGQPQHHAGDAEKHRIGNGGNGTRQAATGPRRLAKALGWLSVGLGAAELAVPGRVSDLVGTRNNDPLVRSIGAREVATGIAILKQPYSSKFLWGRVGGDLVNLALIGTAAKARGSRKRRLIAAAAAVGGVAALDVLCSARLTRAAEPIHVTRSITIARPARELYDLWQEALPQIMAHFAHVYTSADDRSHWAMNLPGERTIQWESQVVERRPGEFMSWKSTDGAPVASEGSIRFSPAPRELGTEVTLDLSLHPPGGKARESILRTFDFVPGTIAEKALRRFKSLAETGEIPTLQGNPSGRKAATTEMGGLTL